MYNIAIMAFVWLASFSSFCAPTPHFVFCIVIYLHSEFPLFSYVKVVMIDFTEKKKSFLLPVLVS